MRGESGHLVSRMIRDLMTLPHRQGTWRGGELSAHHGCEVRDRSRVHTLIGRYVVPRQVLGDRRLQHWCLRPTTLDCSARDAGGSRSHLIRRIPTLRMKIESPQALRSTGMKKSAVRIR